MKNLITDRAHGFRSFANTASRAAIAVFLSALTSISSPVFGQETTPRAVPRVIELDALTIEGRVAKPQVFYVLGRSRIEYENLRMQRVFVDRIIDTARKNRF